MIFTYTLSKSRRILKYAYSLYTKRGGKLSAYDRSEYEKEMEALDQALLKKNRKEADFHARKIQAFNKTHFPKSLFDHTRELVFALGFALIFAFLIRSFWFELYEVPTGSMRPTIEELDRLVVSKTTFGINFPFKNDLFLYKPEYLQRNAIFTFTVEDMDVADSKTMYFYLFPGIKRFVKRCCGKPGDTLYFYGGRIYAIDKEGNPVDDFYNEEKLKDIGIEKIDHIPYISIGGRAELSKPLMQGVYGSALLKQMNLPVVKLETKKDGTVTGKFFNGKEWQEDRIDALKQPHDQPMSYSDLWGIGNYAVARLLSKAEAQKFHDTLPKADAELYLELHHTPNATYPHPELRPGETGNVQPTLTPFVTLIPINREHLKKIQENLYTARFFVQNGRAYRYTEGKRRPQRAQFDPLFTNVPDGLYEFYYGKGYKIHFGGIRSELPSDHPLYNENKENIAKLFNLGFHFHSYFEPMAEVQPFMPQRFAYYRDGSLYLMGAKIFEKNDPVLEKFVEQELSKQESSSEKEPYIAFVDHGAPLKDGKLDVDFIKAFGLKLPDHGALALGDNYAMSGDSREFGFVPIGNLRGSPSFTFWPPSNRIGALPQPTKPWITLPNVIIWVLVLIISLLIYFYIRNRNKKSIYSKKEF